jgi:hypothetical protein
MGEDLETINIFMLNLINDTKGPNKGFGWNCSKNFEHVLKSCFFLISSNFSKSLVLVSNYCV